MNQSSPFGFPPFDPNKMDPKLLMELSQLIQQLPAEHLSRMQTLMHNMMAGYDVSKDMEEFEKSLPPSFRIRMATLMANSKMPPPDIEVAPANATGATPIETHSSSSSANEGSEMNVREARLTILRGVASGHLKPEEAEKLLFG